ncbi:MAG: mechanosensitive ion channel family protein [Propionibacteriaceae bacterium]|nr:mechanosensitive ion channel family protein [Propionibacteriaceae bacterium]
MDPMDLMVETEALARIGLVVVVAVVGRWLLVRGINLAVKRAVKRSEKVASGWAGKALGVRSPERYEQRLKTIGTLSGSVVTFTIAVIALITILSLLSVPVAPLLASAGIGGVALGFGAQSLVKDFLAGIAMIIEDQYGVGDLIDTGSATGTVEDVGLRVTRLRDATGQVWYVRNGEILRVGNQSQGWSTAVADVPIAPDEDTAKALAALEQAADEVAAEGEFADVLLERPNVVGVNEMTPYAMTLRIVAKTAPNKHWPVQRALLEQAQNALTAAGIRQPAPGVIAG